MLTRTGRLCIRQPKRFFQYHYSVTSCDYDILICGGGVVGASFALNVLNKTSSKCRIGIIENKPPHELKFEKSTPDIRIYALAPKSIQFLRELGAWKYIQTRSHPYEQMQIWESNGPGLVRFCSRNMSVEELGRTCEDVTIQSALYQTMRDAGHSVDLIYGATVTDIMVPGGEMNTVGHAQVTVTANSAGSKSRESTDSRVLNTRLLVGADGAQSVVRRLCGMSTWGWQYGQEALVASVRLVGWKEEDNIPTDVNDQTSRSLNHSNDTAWQRYLSSGPLALLPLWNGCCSIVWSNSVTEVRRLKALSKEEFVIELNQALHAPSHSAKWSVHSSEDATGLPPFLHNIFASTQRATNVFNDGSSKIGLNLLQRVKREVASLADTAMSAALHSDLPRIPPKIASVESARISFPLSFSQASSYVMPRIALIGDAAHSIHPQAGQGLNLGLHDAECLAELVVQSMKVGADFGDVEVLKKGYHDERYHRNLAMMTTVDGINRMFTDNDAIYTKNVTSNASKVSSNEVNDSNNSTAVNSEINTNQPGGGSGGETNNKTKQLLRSIGMLAVHGSGPVKSRMAKYAMGLSDEK